MAMSNFRLPWWLLEMATSEVGSRKSEVGSRKSEVGSRKSEIGSRKSEIGTLEPQRQITQRPNICLFTHCVNDYCKKIIF
jgi:hypothetical protein